MSALSSRLRAVPRLMTPILVLLMAVVLLSSSGLVGASGPSGTVRGFITATGTGAGIVGAWVTVSASDVPWSFETVTGAGGSFAASVPNHEYTVTASASAYLLNSTTVSVGSGQTAWANLTLTAASPRSARLQGFVTDSSTAAPVDQGQVVTQTSSWAIGARYRNSTALNATGYYQIDLVGGYYDISTEGVPNYSPFLYSYLSLGTGTVTWYNFTLDPLVAWINGTVQDATNYSPISGATITASVNSLDLIPTASNGSGDFSLRAPTGYVTIVADAPGYAPETYSVYVWGSGTTFVSLYLSRLSTHIRGSVHDGLTGAPIPGAIVTANPFWSSGYWDQAIADASGAYVLSLTADDFTLTVTATGYTSAYTWAFLSTGDNVWWNVTLWPRVSTLKGYLIDGGTGSPVTGMAVYVSDGRSGYSASVATDATGLFMFLLPPSPALTLRVWGAAPYAGAMAYPTTRPYETTWANLTLARLTAVLFANVTDASTGLPVSGTIVSVSWFYGSNYGTTDSAGTVSIPVLGGTTLSVGAGGSSYLFWYETIPGFTGTGSISIELFPSLVDNVTVRGYVRDANTNASISSAYVQASGYGSSTPYDYTDGLGYYQLSIVPAPQTVRATRYSYAAGVGAVNPPPGSTIWLNFSLAPDTTAPAILSFTASPATNLGPSNPASLAATINETSMGRASLSIFRLRSTSAGVGTFLDLGPLDASRVSLTPTTPGNYSVASSWDTRTNVGWLSDGTTSEWWPAPPSYYPYQATVTGTWDNATVPSPAYATAVFDTRTGALLYVYTYPYGYISPQEQPVSTFTPSAIGWRIDLTTAAIVGYAAVTGSTYRLGSLGLTVYNPAPGGTYAGVLEAYDAGSNYAAAAVLMGIYADTVAPTARAGPDQTVNQGVLVTLDGSASSDNTGIVNYTWTFTDGGARVLYGSVVAYRFQNPGTYTVTLTVRDAAGNRGSGALTVHVLDTTSPTVAFVAPLEGANVTGTVLLTASASDNVGVVRVEFFSNGVSLGTASTLPFSITVNTATLGNGPHTLTAVAYDAAGNNATATLHVTVWNAGGGGILGADTTTWLIAIGLIVAGVAAVLVLVLMRRRRRAVSAPPPMTPPPTEP